MGKYERITLANSRILEIDAVINPPKDDVKSLIKKEPKLNIFFKLALSRNKLNIHKEAVAIRDIIRQSKDFRQYEESRINLCKKMALKDENGAPMLRDGSYVFPNQSEFDKALEDLKKKDKKYQQAIKEQEEKIDSFNEGLKETIEIEYYPIEAKYLDDEIPADMLFALVEFVKGDIPEDRMKKEEQKDEQKDEVKE